MPPLRGFVYVLSRMSGTEVPGYHMSLLRSYELRNINKRKRVGCLRFVSLTRLRFLMLRYSI